MAHRSPLQLNLMKASPVHDHRLDVERWRALLTPRLLSTFGGSIGLVAPAHEPVEPGQPLKLMVRAPGGAPLALVICASSAAPERMARAMKQAVRVRRELGPLLGRMVAEPVLAGTIAGRSYCVLSHCAPLEGRSPSARVRAHRLAPRLLDWLRAASARTLTPVGHAARETGFDQPLIHLLESEGLSDRIRNTAERALARLHAGKWTPRHVLMHGELHRGSVLVVREAERRVCPVLVDWRRAVLRGYGIFDLVRLASSLRLSRKRLKRELEQHCELLGCHLFDAQHHFVTALGHAALAEVGSPPPRMWRQGELGLDMLEALA